MHPQAANPMLDQALQLSQRMASLGAEGDWAQVVELEKQRSGLLERAFAGEVSVDELMASQIRAILDLDRELMSLGVAARGEVAAELGLMQRGRKGSQAYRSSP